MANRYLSHSGRSRTWFTSCEAWYNTEDARSSYDAAFEHTKNVNEASIPKIRYYRNIQAPWLLQAHSTHRRLLLEQTR